MSSFQAYYEQLHQRTVLPPPPLRAHATVAALAPALLPPAFADDAWFRLYPEIAPRAEDVAEPGPTAGGTLSQSTATLGQRSAPERAPSLRSLKADVLGQLGRYQVYAERLRKWDRDSYQMFRRLGMYLLPAGMEAERGTLEPAVRRNLPGFGAISMDLRRDHADDDKMPARFIYFRKLDRPGCDVERRGAGVTYRCHIYWDDADDKVLNKHRGYGLGQDYAVQVTPEGQVHALRMRQSQPQTIRHKHGRYRGYDSTVVHQRWELPELEPIKGISRADSIVSLFCLTMNFWAQAASQSIIRVTATKGRVVMPFVVDVLQTPGFFADREPVIIDGKKRRIFHIVRAHVRHTKHGDLPIKTHFAGLRQFTWNGYDIAITVPGRDHRDLAELDIGALEDPTAEEDASGLLMEQTAFAELVADAIGAPAA